MDWDGGGGDAVVQVNIQVGNGHSETRCGCSIRIIILVSQFTNKTKHIFLTGYDEKYCTIIYIYSMS